MCAPGTHSLCDAAVSHEDCICHSIAATNELLINCFWSTQQPHPGKQSHLGQIVCYSSSCGCIAELHRHQLFIFTVAKTNSVAVQLAQQTLSCTSYSIQAQDTHGLQQPMPRMPCQIWLYPVVTTAASVLLRKCKQQTVPRIYARKYVLRISHPGRGLESATAHCIHTSWSSLLTDQTASRSILQASLHRWCTRLLQVCCSIV